MLAQAAGPTDQPLLEMTIGDNLEATVGRFGDQEALVVPHQSVRQTYNEFNETVDRLAAGLVGLGVGAGDRVGIWSPNRAEWVWVQYATAKIGAILVNINPAYRTEELKYSLNQSGCRLLFASEAYLTSNYRGMVDEVNADLPNLGQSIYFDSPQWQALLVEPTPDARADVTQRGSSLSATDAINIQYTSGTTGFPKGATLSHRNIINNAYFVGAACEYTEHDRVCVPVPFYHCFGMVMGNLACTTRGATIVVPGLGFDPQQVLDTVENERCTSLYGVPTMFIAELADSALASRDLSSLRTGIMAGAQCPVEVMERVMDSMGMEGVTIAYGMTETSPVSTQTSANDSVEMRVNTVGAVHPHVEIKIIDPDTQEVMQRGARGELCTRGYSVMKGYWNQPELTEASIDSDGWMHSGDLAEMDDAGYVSIVGRIKDMIVRGGENIYPAEIEEFLYSHPAVEAVQVIGVPNEKYGEDVMAWVKLIGGADPMDAEDIREFCRDRIAHFKVPRYVSFVDEFPMTVTGKVRKVAMRETSIAELGL